MQKKLFSKSKCVSNMLISCDHKESLINFEGGDTVDGTTKGRPDPEDNSGIMKCLCPTKFTPAEFPEGKSLRRFQLLLLLLEIIYIFNDIYFFASPQMALFEVPRAWMCYYNFITLNRCMMNFYMVYVAVGAAMSVLSILTVGFSGMFNLILLPAQLGLMIFTAYLLWFKIEEFVKGREAWKRGDTKKTEEPTGEAETKA